MDWSGQIEYAKADWKKFEVDGEEAGLTTGYGPLNFLKVLLNHVDQPLISSIPSLSISSKGDLQKSLCFFLCFLTKIRSFHVC